MSNPDKQQNRKTSLLPSILACSMVLCGFAVFRSLMNRDPVEKALSNIEGMHLEDKVNMIIDPGNGQAVHATSYNYKAKGFWFEISTTEKNKNGDQIISTAAYPESTVEFAKELREVNIKANARLHGKTVNEFKVQLEKDANLREAVDIAVQLVLPRNLKKLMILSYETRYRNGVELPLPASPDIQKGGNELRKPLTPEQIQNFGQIFEFSKRINDTIAEAKGLKPAEQFKQSHAQSRGVRFNFGPA